MRALLDHLTAALERNQSLLELNLGDLSAEEVARPAGPGGNTAHWIVGHIAYWRSAMLVTLGHDAIFDVGIASEFEGLRLGDAPASLALPFHEVREKAAEGAKRLTERLRHFDGDASDARLQRVASLVIHEAYHVGQLGILRRVVGKPGVVGVPR